jgi:hypothetical protein
MEKISDTQAAAYLALYDADEVFSQPANFVTLRRSNSDLARCVWTKLHVALLSRMSPHVLVRSTRLR